MSDHFEVGEIAIYWRPISPRHGLTVMIESGLVKHFVFDTVTGGEGWCFAHAISFSTCGIGAAPYGVWCAEPHELRKRKDWMKLCELVECKDEVEA